MEKGAKKLYFLISIWKYSHLEISNNEMSLKNELSVLVHGQTKWMEIFQQINTQIMLQINISKSKIFLLISMKFQEWFDFWCKPLASITNGIFAI